ncbi:MAG: arginine repressor [Oscillospiraceae bacterium]
MKKQRLDLILNLVTEKSVTTQDELLCELKKHGFNVTQATISRDIKELRLSKITDKNGISRYYVAAKDDENEFSDKFRTIFTESVISVAKAGNLVVLKCYTGMGNAACAALDSMRFTHIVGTIAGDDTIFAAVETQDDAHSLVDKLNVLLYKD